MLLRNAQNIVTIVFLLLMLVNIGLGYSYNGVKVINIYLPLFGVHLSVILAYYFTQDTVGSKKVPVFKLVLILILVLLWNALIAGIALDAKREYEVLRDSLSVFPEYAGFLIAGGIVWLFSGGTRLANPLARGSK